MTSEEKIKAFEEVTCLILDPRLRKGLEEIVSSLPEYFFHVASSSTEKYHPRFSLGKGGLLRHSVLAAKICFEMLRNPIFYDFENEVPEDILIIACAVHDGQKRGPTNEGTTHSLFEHPILMQKFLLENEDRFPSLTHDEIFMISELVKTHMGPWTTSPRNPSVTLEEPMAKGQKFVHLCDYVSSRKCFDD